MKPRVFVSSTILDFEDLRSAVKFYLQEFGFEVQMSEYPNFDVDLDSSTFDACFKNIEQCQYYILIIGYRRGSWYEPDKISITHQEYLTTKKLIENGHPIRIIAFVRRPIWLLKNDRDALIKHFENKSKELADELAETGSSVIDDPKYIFNFVDEVSRGVNLPDSTSPVNNWIFDFENFQDIVEALRQTFKISENLSEKRLKTLFIKELEHNINRFMVADIEQDFDPSDKSVKIPKKNILDYYRKSFFPRMFDSKGKPIFTEQGLNISGTEVKDLLLHATIYPMLISLSDVKTTFLEKVISEGLFLNYNIATHDFDVSLISLALEKLLDWIGKFKKTFENDFYKKFNDEIARLATDGSAYKGSISISIETSGIIMAFGASARIPELISCLLKYFKENDHSDLVKFDFNDSNAYKYNKNS